jgi:hypothetical protein
MSFTLPRSELKIRFARGNVKHFYIMAADTRETSIFLLFLPQDRARARRLGPVHGGFFRKTSIFCPRIGGFRRQGQAVEGLERRI